MPIEIRELVIRAVVDAGELPAQDDQDHVEANNLIVEATVARVLAILRRQQER